MLKDIFIKNEYAILKIKMEEFLMPIATYLTFEDQSKEAIAFYEEAFETSCHDLITYGTLGMPDLDEKVKN